MAIEHEVWKDGPIPESEFTELVEIEFTQAEWAIIQKKAKAEGWNEAYAARRFIIHMGYREEVERSDPAKVAMRSRMDSFLQDG